MGRVKVHKIHWWEGRLSFIHSFIMNPYPVFTFNQFPSLLLAKSCKNREELFQNLQQITQVN